VRAVQLQAALEAEQRALWILLPQMTDAQSRCESTWVDSSVQDLWNACAASSQVPLRSRQTARLNHPIAYWGLICTSVR